MALSTTAEDVTADCGESGGSVPAILIEDARKDYGRAAGSRREAVAGVSISVSRGAIHGLLGPNGAGKTTTLKMLLGLVRPSGGRFEILGVPADQPGARRNVGFLPEQPYFPSQLTAGEALALYGRLTGLTAEEIARQSGELLERVGLEGREKTLLAKFSRGMLQRLGLAQALLGYPCVLVLDEPASGLDPVGQRDVRNLMLELKSDGATILLSSHQLSEVETVSDEVTVLNRGQVAARGHIDDLLNVAGQTSVRAMGQGPFPEVVAAVVSDEAVTGSTRVFSVPDGRIRDIVDALDDAGWTIVSLQPKRASLEEYFSRLVQEGSVESDDALAPEGSESADGGDSW